MPGRIGARWPANNPGDHNGILVWMVGLLQLAMMEFRGWTKENRAISYSFYNELHGVVHKCSLSGAVDTKDAAASNA